MTVFDWIEAAGRESLYILSQNIWHSLVMGAISVVVAGIALAFNHYDWRRAKVLSLMSVASMLGWYLSRRMMFGAAVDEGVSFTETVFGLLLTLFLVAGYYLAGLITALKSRPIITTKLFLIRILRTLADSTEQTIMVHPTVKKQESEHSAMTYIANVLHGGRN